MTSATVANSARATAVESGVISGGLYSACVSTFAADESLDTGAFRSVIEYQLSAGIDGLLVAGTTGEAHALSFEERRLLFQTAVKCAANRVPVVGGTGATSTREAFRLLHLAAECGCSAAMVLTPWFEHPTPDALLRYFDELVRAAVLPIMLYNNPSRTGLEWPPEAIARLARELGDGVIGIKDSAGRADRVSAMRELAPPHFKIFSGGPHERAAFAAAGADGCVDGVSNLLAPEGVEAMSGDSQCVTAFDVATKEFMKSKNPIALLKASMELAGLPAGKARRPHDVADPQELDELARRLKAHGRLAAVRRAEPRPELNVADCVRLADFKIEPAPRECTALTIHQPGEADYRYSHHSCLGIHQGSFFAAWSSGIVQEDSPGQLIRFSTSANGRDWLPARLAIADAPGTQVRWTASGLWSHNSQLWLLATRYTRARYVDGARTPDICWEDLGTDGFLWDGAAFQHQGKVIDDFYSNEAPRQHKSGSWIWPGVNARHDAIVAVSASGAPGSWQLIVLSKRTGTSKLTEPSWYSLRDGRIRMLFRDDGGSRRIWVSESADGGTTWTVPAPTDIPDAQAKFHAFELQDGRIALIGNATASDLRRCLLTVAISSDGNRFERCISLRNEPTIKPRFPGMHKAAGFQYPHALPLPNGFLAIYSINKEDIAVQAVEL